MSKHDNSSGSSCLEPVETFKCSQCNFYTNHEFYLKQHSLSHCLQTGIEDSKPNNEDQPQPYVDEMQSYVKNELQILHCLQCDFQTDQDVLFERHVQMHNKPLPELFTGSTNSAEPSGPVGEQFADDNVVGFRYPQCQTVMKCVDSLDTIKCDNSDRDLPTPPFSEDQKIDMKSHIKESEETLEPSQVQKTVFRCNNCDYETNLKAFIKRHMQTHNIKVEIKDSVVETFRCAQCKFETHHKKYLKRHKLSHKENRQYKCSKCDFQTLHKKMYLIHQVKKHNANVGRRKKNHSKLIKCKECSFMAEPEVLDIHNKIEHTTATIDINLHKCPYCKYQTNWEPCLRRHIEREHPEGKSSAKVKKEKEKIEVKEEATVQEPLKPDLFRCDNCDFTSKNKQYLVLHLKRSHVKVEPKTEKTKKNAADGKPRGRKDKQYECKFRNCTFQSVIKSNYVYHMRKHQSQNPQRILFHFCDLCDAITKTEESLTEHKNRMHLNREKQVYGCNQCDFQTVFKHSLKTHSIKHKRYTCSICDEELESAFALVKHRRSHQINPKNRIFLCDVCGFQSKNDRSLKMHKKTHNPEFKCPDCPFQTHSKVNFQNHCINHKSADEVTMFPCPHCSYQSRLKRNLAWHMKRHADPSKAQIFKCPSCEYQTFTNAQLKSHLMVHKNKEEVVMLKCDFCTFETKRKSNMVQHRLRHLKDSPDVPLLSCPDCNYTTVAKRHLNKHRKTHNNNPDKMFQCIYCSYKIHRKVYLMRHMENHKTVETFGDDQWQRYSFPTPQPQMAITGVTVVPNVGQNNVSNNLGHNLM